MAIEITFTKEATYNGRKRFEARIEGAPWNAPRVVIEQTYGISKHGATRGQRLGPADHWTAQSKVHGRQEQLHNGWGSKAAMKQLARAWLEQRAGNLSGFKDDVRGLVQAASLLGGLSLGRASSSAGLRRTGRRATGEVALRLQGRVAGVDPATAAVDLDIDGQGDIRTAQPRAADFALQQEVHRRLRVGLEVVLDAATMDEPPQAARQVTLLRIVGVR